MLNTMIIYHPFGLFSFKFTIFLYLCRGFPSSIHLTSQFSKSFTAYLYLMIVLLRFFIPIYFLLLLYCIKMSSFYFHSKAIHCYRLGSLFEKMGRLDSYNTARNTILKVMPLYLSIVFSIRLV